jgi:hypothetical protein
MTTTEILATYTIEELQELLQFVETKEGRFENLKLQLKDELAVRIPFWVPGVSRGIESPTQYYHLTKVVNSITYQHHAY